MIQIERVEVVQFSAIMIAGRTSPLLLTCEKADGSTIEAIVKFATGRECTQKLSVRRVDCLAACRRSQAADPNARDSNVGAGICG